MNQLLKFLPHLFEIISYTLVATIVDDQRFNRTNMRSVLNSLSCSATTPSLGQCNTTMKGSACFTSVSKCSTEVGLRCHSK